MTAAADLVTAALAREVVAAAGAGVRVLAVTSPLSLVAGLVARATGAPGLAIATGFEFLDAVDPRPAVTLGEAAYGIDAAARGPAADTFVALGRGRILVAVTPAQLDGRGAVNLSGVGGEPGRPKVALPGHRGLPENNDAPSRVVYVFAQHSPRSLVAEVDVVSGAPPSAGRYRRLITPLGVFGLTPGSGWAAVSLSAGVDAGAVHEATGFPVAIGAEVPVTPAPTREERHALEAADPHGLRALEFLAPDEAAARVAAASAAERAA